MTRITRREVLTNAVFASTSVALGSSPARAAQKNDRVFEAVNRELLALNGRIQKDLNPRPDRLRELASYLRILDVAMDDHDRKKQLRNLRFADADLALVPQGIETVISADEWTRRQHDRKSRVAHPAGVLAVGQSLLASGQLFSEQAIACDALAAAFEKEWNLAGIKDVHPNPNGGRPLFIQDRLNQARASNCEAAAAWGLLLGFQGVLFIPIFPAAAAGYAIAAVIFDAYAVFAC